MIDTRSLRHFVAVAQELHFGQAARRLNMSQPPLSISIRQLEERLGVPLFIRSQRSVELTPAGSELLTRALHILEALEHATSAVRAVAKGCHGVLRIGYTAASAYQAVPTLIAAYQQHFPLVELELLEMVSAQQVTSLLQHRIDVGVLRPIPIKAPLQSHAILQESLVVAVHPSHPLAQQDTVALADLDGAAFIGFDLSHAAYFNAMVEKVLHHAGVTPRVLQRAIHTHAVVAMVAAGLGLALVPELVVQTVGRTPAGET
jgi:DNA-binding transcriptional LysR family regulator